MKTSAKAILLSLVMTATAIAQTPAQPGTWSVYAASGSHAGKGIVLVQTVSLAKSPDGGETVGQAKLDIICKNGKLAAIALEPAVEIGKASVSYSGTIPTTRIAILTNGQANQVDNWAIEDGGRTLTPYSELSQGKVTGRWIERISTAQSMSFRVETNGTAAQATFQTGELAAALFSAGCSN